MDADTFGIIAAGEPGSTAGRRRGPAGPPRLSVRLAALLALAGCASAPQAPVRSPSAAALAAVRLDPAVATAELNAYRASRGLKPVRLDPALEAMAERQAQAMAASG
ncbi:MAG: hypothetical protein JO288_13690, partial [Hyphomicrobiales bacterium]|nr:hypothetical protein [Hyphomicrobiales bacterium]